MKVVGLTYILVNLKRWSWGRIYRMKKLISIESSHFQTFQTTCINAFSIHIPWWKKRRRWKMIWIKTILIIISGTFSSNTHTRTNKQQIYIRDIHTFKRDYISHVCNNRYEFDDSTCWNRSISVRTHANGNCALGHVNRVAFNWIKLFNEWIILSVLNL